MTYHSSEMTEITIDNDPSLVNLLRISIQVTKLFLINNENLRDIRALSRLFQLKELYIINCLNVTSFEIFSKI